MKMVNKEYIFDIEREYIDNMFIFESRGINDNYTYIVDEVVNYCKNNKPNILDNNKFFYHADDFKIQSKESFIDSLSFKIYVTKDGNNGEFRMKDNKPHFLKNGKLINVEFKIFVDGNNGNFNEPLLRELLSHELHHAYRYQQIFLNNGGKLPESDTNRDNAYNHSIENMSLEKKKNILYYLFYQTDENEVMALCAEAYQKFKNQNVTRENYQNVINETEPMNIINSINAVLLFLKNNSSNDKIIENIGSIYNDFLKSKNKKTFSNKTAYRLLKQFLIYKENFVYNQFYKVLGKAIMENEQSSKTVKSFPKVTNEKAQRNLEIFLENYNLWN